MTGKVVHCKRDQFDVYIGRPGPWGNPFTHLADASAPIRVATRDQAIAEYKGWLWQEIKNGRVDLEALAALDGKTLGCWCAPKACHGEVLLAAAEWAARKIHRCEDEMCYCEKEEA